VLDTSTELGARVYELVKRGTLSWSIGYTIPEGGRRRDGKITKLVEIDLAEISVVPTPANADARTLSIKSALRGADPDAVALREHEALAGAFASWFAPKSVRPTSAPEIAEERDLSALSMAELKSYGDELTKDIETRPIQIVSFEC
jgi:hypothetical protein